MTNHEAIIEHLKTIKNDDPWSSAIMTAMTPGNEGTINDLLISLRSACEDNKKTMTRIIGKRCVDLLMFNNEQNMKGLIQMKFGHLPRVCRAWAQPTTGRFKNFLLFGVKTGDKFTTIDTHQVFYPDHDSLSIQERILNISNYLYSLTQKQKPVTMATKTKKKPAKKKAVSKKSASADLINSVIGKFSAGTDNKVIAEKTGLTVKQVRDAKFRIKTKKAA